MDPVLYSVVDGATNDLVRQDIISNNLANLNTPGFKGDLYQAQVMYLTGQNGNILPNAQTYIVEMPSSVDTTPGAIKTTGRPLDVAINGNGYFAVQSPDGTESYTRGGSFQIDANGMLITPSGRFVLGDGGPITIPPAKSIAIGSDGTISIVPLEGDVKSLAVIDRLRTVTIDPNNATRGSDGLVRLSQGIATPNDTIQVVGGALEDSNVNAIDQMVQMISASRDFDAQMKIMSTVNEDAQKLAQVLQY